MQAAADEDRISKDLAVVAGEDEAEAREAFDRLWRLTQRATLRRMARWDVVGEEAEDVCQDVCVKLWRLRRTIGARTAGGWYALVRKAVGRGLSDHWERRGDSRRAESIDDENDIPAKDDPYLDAFAAAALSEQWRRVYDAADRAWLGAVEEGNDAAVATLKLILVDGVGAEDAAAVFASNLEDVERWMSNPALVLRAAFAGLCWPNDALAGHVLRPENPLAAPELDALMRGGLEGGALRWSEEEARVVCARVRYGLLVDRLREIATGLQYEEVEAIVTDVPNAYPFRHIAKTIRRTLEDRGVADLLGDGGLWRRIVFEYDARNALPHEQILERAAPAAEEARFNLNRTTLGNWFGHGRLWGRLATQIRRDAE